MATRTITSLITCILSIHTLAAQEKLRFTPAEWDFGTIRETDGRVSHTFVGENRSDEPLVILDVVTTCGCTAPEFSKRPILPGQQTRITVTYDPANRPGSFDRELWVYASTREKVAVLTIRGHVTPRPKSVEEEYPVDAGDGLRLSSTLCAFSYIYPGQRRQSVIGYANTSDRAVRLDLRPEISSGLLSIDYPQSIPPGGRGQINIGYTNPDSQPRYGTIRDALRLAVNGQDRDVRIVSHAIGADDPALTAKERAPRCEISENILKFGPVKHRAPTQRRTFTLSNRGSGELVIRAVECSEEIVSTLRPGTRLRPGESMDVTVSLTPAPDRFGMMSSFLLLVTNDPSRPMCRLRVTAILEE